MVFDRAQVQGDEYSIIIVSKTILTQVILTKVGYFLRVVTAIVVIFIALRIFGYNIGELFFTWVRRTVVVQIRFLSTTAADYQCY